MRHTLLSATVVMTLVAASMVVDSAEPASDTRAAAPEGLSSTKDHGVIKVVPDPALANGRLVLKIVAFNRDRKNPATFGPGNVKVFTAAGEAVPLLSLDQLIAQARGSKDGRGDKVVDVYGTQGPT